MFNYRLWVCLVSLFAACYVSVDAAVLAQDQAPAPAEETKAKRPSVTFADVKGVLDENAFGEKFRLLIKKMGKHPTIFFMTKEKGDKDSDHAFICWTEYGLMFLCTKEMRIAAVVLSLPKWEGDLPLGAQVSDSFLDVAGRAGKPKYYIPGNYGIRGTLIGYEQEYGTVYIEFAPTEKARARQLIGPETSKETIEQLKEIKILAKQPA